MSDPERAQCTYCKRWVPTKLLAAVLTPEGFPQTWLCEDTDSCNEAFWGVLPRLRAEVGRLQDEVAHLRARDERFRFFALEVRRAPFTWVDGDHHCRYCGVQSGADHDPNCLWLYAKELLEDESDD